MAERNKIIRKGDSRACAYVWTKNPGRKTSKTVLISAHGDSAWINGDFPKGKYRLTYYCPHGTNLVDVGLELFIKNLAMPAQTVSYPDICQDYNLMKYQNKHNKKGESYELVGKFVDSGEVDVVTIKNYTDWAGDREGMKLSELVTLLFACGYDYDSIHCAFCRGGEHFKLKSFFTGESTSYEPFVERI